MSFYIVNDLGDENSITESGYCRPYHKVKTRDPTEDHWLKELLLSIVLKLSIRALID